jgi:hypothetical protein
MYEIYKFRIIILKELMPNFKIITIRYVQIKKKKVGLK